MFDIKGEIVIKRRPEEVFDFVADERNEPRFNARMRSAEKISDGPIGVGTRYRAELDSMGRSVPMDIEYTAYERPQRLGSSSHLSSMDIDGTLTFDPAPEGTRMRWSWSVEPRGRLMRATRPIAAFIGRRQERAVWAGLKRLLEKGGPPLREV